MRPNTQLQKTHNLLPDVKIDDMVASSSSASSEPHYTLSPQPPHADSSIYPLPTDPTPPPQPMSLREAPGPDVFPDHRPTLAEFRAKEGPAVRASKLRALWKSLPPLPSIPDGDEPTPTQKMQLPGQGTTAALSPERAERLRRLYEEELVKRISEKRPDSSLWGGPDDLEPEMRNLKGKNIAWQDFRRFLWDKEKELWDIFQELDHNADGRLDAQEMRAALARSGVDVTPATVSDLVHFLASHSNKEGLPKGARQEGSEEGLYLTFADFRDFLIMLPRKATPFEIYKCKHIRSSCHPKLISCSLSSPETIL